MLLLRKMILFQGAVKAAPQFDSCKSSVLSVNTLILVTVFLFATLYESFSLLKVEIDVNLGC